MQNGFRYVVVRSSFAIPCRKYEYQWKSNLQLHFITSLLRTLIIIPAAAAGHFGGHLIVSENNLIRTL